MTAREIFEKVKTSLLSQAESSKFNGKCFYRHPFDNLKCAIGHLIPDELYQSTIENCLVKQLPDNILDHILPDDFDRETGISFLIEIQLIHDYWLVKNWERRFNEVEKEFFGVEIQGD